jgi:hypothetical protein
MSAQDQIIDAVMALALQADAIRMHPLMAWIVMQDNATGSGAFVARLVTDAATPYILLAGMLAGLRDQLPPGLTRTDRQPADSPEIVEIWFPSDSDRARVSFAPARPDALTSRPVRDARNQPSPVALSDIRDRPAC